MALDPLSGPMEDPADRFSREVLFPNGLPGFPHLHRFRLLTDPTYTPPFELLASEEDPDIGFYLVDPSLVERGYAPTMAEADQHDLHINPDDEVLLRAIVTIGTDPQSSTANLMAPLIFNLTAELGCQTILEGSPYSMRTPLFTPSV